MIHTSDKKNKYSDMYIKTIIPCSKEEKEEPYAIKELYYPNARDYKEMSYSEIEEYIKRYYLEVLSKLDPEKIYEKIRYTILVSDERTDSLAKRHIVSEWLRLYIGDKISESYYDEEKQELVKLKRPDFIRVTLEKIIRSSIENMRGFKSLRALYFFEKGEKLEQLANELEGKTDKYGYDSFDYRQEACYYRCDADEAEYQYIARLNEKSKTLLKKYPDTAKISTK